MSDDRFIKGGERDAPPHDHAVHVYADDHAISQELVRFVDDGIRLGESVVVAASDLHRASLAAWRAVNPPIGGNEFLLVLDAAETLDRFMVAGIPDRALFEETVGAAVQRAARGGRSVRVFGEMVAQLWADGNVTGALALESLWNDMASDRQFFLLCAYPETVLDAAPLAAVNAMCGHHSDLSLLGHHMQFAAAKPATRSHVQRLLIPLPNAVSAAGQIATRVLVEWDLTHLLPNCLTLTSELAANAVAHAESAFRLTLSRDATTLRIAVDDAFPRLPVPNTVVGVEAIASAWGCDVTPDGKTVWVELRV